MNTKIQLTFDIDLTTVEGVQLHNALISVMQQHYQIPDAPTPKTPTFLEEVEKVLVEEMSNVWIQGSAFVTPVTRENIMSVLGSHPKLANLRGLGTLNGAAAYIEERPTSNRGLWNNLNDQLITWHTEPDGVLHLIVEERFPREAEHPDLPKGDDGTPLSEDTPAPGADDF